MRNNISQTELKLYQDRNAITEVLADLMRNPQLLTTHPLKPSDFVDVIHIVIFSAIQYLARYGVKYITVDQIEDYLKNYPAKLNNFKKVNGTEYLIDALADTDQEHFEIAYTEVRKYGALRQLLCSGVDVSEYFDPHEEDPELLEEARNRFENDSVERIIAFYQTKIFNVNIEYSNNNSMEFLKAGGEDLLKMIELWQQEPDFGMSYASQFLTTATNGIRREKYTIMSSPSGTGKTRVSIANLCRSFVPEFWDIKEEKWVVNPHRNFDPDKGMNALYIGTEMELLEEIQPIILAYMSAVDESKIKGFVRYEAGEKDRVIYAAKKLQMTSDDKGQPLKDFGIYLAYLPEYNTEDLESVIKKFVTEHNVGAVFLDYLMTTPNLLAEWRSIAGNMGQREDQALANLSKKLKDLARKYKISIDTCTQVSGDYKNENNRDETIVRGAKSVIDKADVAMILSEPTEKELDKVKKYYRGIEKPMPNRCITLYKNRGGSYNKIKIWLYIDYGTMRVHDLIVTNRDETQLVPIKKSRVIRDVQGNILVTTDDDAKKLYRDGVISKESLEEVEKAEKEDRSYKTISVAEKAELEKAKAAVADSSMNEIQDDDYDDAFDY